MGTALGKKKKSRKTRAEHTRIGPSYSIAKETTVLNFYNMLTRDGTNFDNDLNYSSEEPQRTWLHIACIVENIPIVEALLYAGVFPNPVDAYGMMPLDYAFKQCNPLLVKLLMQYNACYTHKLSDVLLSLKKSPQIEKRQAFLEKEEEMQVFFEKEKESDFSRYRTGIVLRGYLEKAVMNDDEGMALQVFEVSVVKQYQKNTLLRHVAMQGSLPMTKLLVNNGAPIIGNNHEKMISQLARKNGHVDIANFLEDTQKKRYKRLSERAHILQKYHLIYFGMFSSDSNLYTDMGQKEPHLAREIIQQAYELEYKIGL